VGEIVKAHAGILDSDPPPTATAKLDAVLPAGEERAWFRQRLMPLLGMDASSPAEREELFTAWRRFFEHVAEAHPTVLVFEDLHWADDALLAFIEHLADRAEACRCWWSARPGPSCTNGIRISPAGFAMSTPST
jgi:predicted ATPase